MSKRLVPWTTLERPAPTPAEMRARAARRKAVKAAWDAQRWARAKGCPNNQSGSATAHRCSMCSPMAEDAEDDD
jgi:hypothetical protein